MKSFSEELEVRSIVGLAALVILLGTLELNTLVETDAVKAFIRHGIRSG